MLNYGLLVVGATHQVIYDREVTPQELSYYMGVMAVALLTMVFNIMMWRTVFHIYKDAVDWTFE
jgi:ABC-type nickel/cobalt efflux system permease component RcnA